MSEHAPTLRGAKTRVPATGQKPGRFVAYLRVSTDGQGRSGLGLEAQRQAVAAYVAQAGGEVGAEFQEVESGKRADRPQLAAALAACRTRRAVLVIAKLDRLARNARFLLSVVEGSGEAGVVFCDLPTVPTGPVGKGTASRSGLSALRDSVLLSVFGGQPKIINAELPRIYSAAFTGHPPRTQSRGTFGL